MVEDPKEVLEGEIVGEDEEIVHPHVDWIPEEYQSRSTDKEGNPDDKLTEKEALAEAKKEGIEYIDQWAIQGDTENRRFDTEAEAKKEADGKELYQTRSVKNG